MHSYNNDVHYVCNISWIIAQHCHTCWAESCTNVCIRFPGLLKGIAAIWYHRPYQCLELPFGVFSEKSNVVIIFCSIRPYNNACFTVNGFEDRCGFSNRPDTILSQLYSSIYIPQDSLHAHINPSNSTSHKTFDTICISTRIYQALETHIISIRTDKRNNEPSHNPRYTAFSGSTRR